MDMSDPMVQVNASEHGFLDHWDFCECRLEQRDDLRGLRRDVSGSTDPNRLRPVPTGGFEDAPGDHLVQLLDRGVVEAQPGFREIPHPLEGLRIIRGLQMITEALWSP